MQIHELDTYIGTPSDTDYLAVDDGTETLKIPMTEVGVSTEMTVAEAEAGTETAPRVIAPSVLNSYVDEAVTQAIAEAMQGIADYITEEGTSGTWKYRKWASGKIEAWGYQSFASIGITIASSPAFGGYRSDVVNMTIPSGIFSRTPDYVFAQKKTSQGGAIYFAGANSATNIQMIFGGCTTSQTITNQVVLAYVVLV